MMNFVVKTLDGKNQAYELEGSTKVGYLKQMVQNDMDILVETQRMILQGKVLKDDCPLSEYNPDGKTIHLVKNAPPNVHTDTKPPPVPEEMRTEQERLDFMYVGGTLPPLPPPEGTPFIQDVAKKSAAAALKSLKEAIPESNYLVTVTMHTLNENGQPVQSATHTTTTHKALRRNRFNWSSDEEEEGDLPRPQETAAEAEIKKQKREEEETRLRRLRLERYHERVKQNQERGREQSNILEIYQHMTSARRAIAGAENIVAEYFSSEEYKESAEMLEHYRKLKAEHDEREREKEAATEASAAADKTDETAGDSTEVPMEVGGATGGEESKKKEGPEYSIGEDGRPRQHILTDTGLLIPAGSALYTSLLEDLVALERRGAELQDFYKRKLEVEQHYELTDYRLNTKLVNTVQRFHNALGQACDAMKKVQVQLDAEPPRIVTLTARPRPAANPLLSLLNQPLSQLANSDSEDDSRGGGGDQSVAGLFGSLLAARALGSLMQEEGNQTTPSGGGATTGTSTNQTTGGAEGSGQGAEGGSPLPGPIQMMTEIAKENARKKQQEEEERTVVIEPNEPFFEVISRIRQAAGGPEAEILPDSIVGDLIEACLKKMSIVDVVTAFGGDPEPLNNLHQILREFISTKLLEGAEPTADNMVAAIERFIRGVPAMLAEMTPPLPLNPDIDFAATVQKCARTVLKDAYEIIINTPVGDTKFGGKIMEWSDNAGTLMTCVVRESLLSSNDLQPSLKRLAKLMLPDNETPGVVNMLNSHSMVDKFVEMSENCNFTEEEIESYLVYVEEEEEKMETTPPKDQDAEVPVVTVDQGGAEFPSTMPEEWKETIKNDVEEMKKVKVQPPLSSAYLEAGPSKKRKLESGEAEAVPVSQILGDSLQSAIDSSGAKPISDGTSVNSIVDEAKQDPSLVQGLCDELHSSTRERLEKDPDYSGEKYPAAQKHYNPSK